MKYEFKVDDFTFTASTISGRKALQVNREIERVCIASLKRVDNFRDKLQDFLVSSSTGEDGSFQFNLFDFPVAELANVIAAAFDELPDTKWTALVNDLLYGVRVTDPDNGKLLELHDNDDRDLLFSGRSGYLYLILYHIMKENKFTPFVLASLGKR